ncbi:MAG: FHA domain-containing protein [Phycisphaeraceae bacterium]|nr:FHA domain-containing protein [Phycisphaeraceae bacterium]
MLILTVIQGPDKGRRFELPDDEPQLVGRSSEALPLQDQTISRRHAELTPDSGKWVLNDLKSANGTFVNGHRVTRPRLLQPGDQIRCGQTLFVFGRDLRPARRDALRVSPREELEVSVESTAISNDESVIMAVPEPTEGAVLQLKVVYELTQLIGSTAERERLLEGVMDLIFDYFQADRGFILLQDDPDGKYEPVVLRHRNRQKDSKTHPIHVSRTIVQHVIRKGEGVLSSNAMTDQRFRDGDSVLGLGIHSAMCVPIKFKDRIFGVIHIDSQIANYTFTDDQLRLLIAIGVHTGLALANAELYADRLNQERLAAVGQTVASLSHSIKNILQGMRGGADVVELGFKKNNMKVVQGGWQIVSRNLERIYELTMNMLAYSKQRQPELEMTNLQPLLEDVVSLMQSQFDGKKVALITDFTSDMPPAPIDMGGMHQALLNLMGNALDAVEPEKGAVTLSCDYDDRTQQVLVSVTDNGTGIEADRVKRLFQPFNSTKGLKGTGLGLVVTKKIVEEHGGAIGVESAPGKGTTFTIRLPCSVESIPSLADTQGPAGGHDSTPRSEGETS